MVKVLGFTKDVNDLEVGSMPSQRTRIFHIFLSINNLFYKFNFVLKIILFLHGEIMGFWPSKILKIFYCTTKKWVFFAYGLPKFSKFSPAALKKCEKSVLIGIQILKFNLLASNLGGNIFVLSATRENLEKHKNIFHRLRRWKMEEIWPHGLQNFHLRRKKI